MSDLYRRTVRREYILDHGTDIPGPIHARIGDLEFGTGEATSPLCFCACQRCLDGGCCQFPEPAPSTTWPTTTTSTTTYPSSGSVTCGALDHDFAVLDPARLFCRKCGTTKAV